MTQIKLNPNCPCANKTCPRHGNCAECRAAHAQFGSPTCCMKQDKDK